jgi:hypothetical protein
VTDEIERDRAAQQAEHADHLRWTAQHAAWGREAEGWIRALRDDVRTLESIRGLLEREEARIKDHIASVRRHEAAITQHEVVLTTLDQSPRAGCGSKGAPSHRRSTEAHDAEAAAHTRLSTRQWQIRQAFAKLGELLESEPPTDGAGG